MANQDSSRAEDDTAADSCGDEWLVSQDAHRHEGRTQQTTSQQPETASGDRPETRGDLTFVRNLREATGDPRIAGNRLGLSAFRECINGGEKRAYLLFVCIHSHRVFTNIIPERLYNRD